MQLSTLNFFNPDGMLKAIDKALEADTPLEDTSAVRPHASGHCQLLRHAFAQPRTPLNEHYMPRLPFSPRQIFNAATDAAAAQADYGAEAEAHPGGPEVEAPSMDMVILGSNTTTGTRCCLAG